MNTGLAIFSHCRLFRRLIGAAFLMVLLCTGVSTADLTQEAAKLEQQRKDFQAAERALSRGDQQHFRKLKAELKDYVLYPYLEYRELKRYLSHAKPKQIKAFLDDYSDTPMANGLRDAWLRLLARRSQWSAYLNAYIPTESASARCRELLARVKTGQAEAAMKQVSALWLVGKSRPRACDPLFTVWREAGYLTQGLVWERIRLAMEASRSSLARYLKRFLVPREQAWVDLWQRVHQDPNLVLRQRLFQKEHPMRQDILVHGIERLAQRDVGKASAAWKQIKGHFPFSLEQQASVERAIALRMALQHHPKALEALAGLPDWAENDQVRDWRIRSALRRGEWERALERIEQLPESTRASEQWRYWHARCLEELGRTGEARKFYAGLSLSRSYYGFLAADRLGVKYHILHEPLPGSESELAALLRIPGIHRAYELFQLGRVIDARREWHHVTQDMEKPQLVRAAKLAQRWGWHDRAIFTVARAEYWDDLVTRFPLAYRTPVEKQAKAQSLDKAWVFAVLRQESAFTADARSTAGALGLMQLMPSTAKKVAKQLKTRLRSDRDLLSADFNIRLGSAYLRTVLDELDGNPVLATAAYNAGPHRVKRWLPNHVMPADVWIETVPFHETRDYLRRVLAYTVIYEQRLGLTPSRLQERMLPISADGLITHTGELRDQGRPS